MNEQKRIIKYFQVNKDVINIRGFEHLIGAPIGTIQKAIDNKRGIPSKYIPRIQSYLIAINYTPGSDPAKVEDDREYY